MLCAGNPKTLEFLKTVYGELCDVFPSKLIHIGGDESPRVRWKACP
ncbi:MAG: family 20 glycosylhydrolase, partial [Prevotella sp.]|nr:family 20 glycosylhydrolase [Prevotella sp.]